MEITVYYYTVSILFFKCASDVSQPQILHLHLTVEKAIWKNLTLIYPMIVYLQIIFVQKLVQNPSSKQSLVSFS